MTISKIVIKKENASPRSQSAIFGGKESLPFTRIELGDWKKKLTKYKKENGRLECPMIGLYRYIGELMGVDWMSDECKYTFLASEIYLTEKTYRELCKLTSQFYIKRDLKNYPKRKQESSLGFLFLEIGPNTSLDGAEDGYVYLSPSWKVKKTKRD